jgi:hypothetical protein
MTTCTIEEYLRANLPGDVALNACGLFDVVPAVSKFKPSSLAGVELDEDWAFGPRVSVVVGPSGSGKTRILEALKLTTGIGPNLMAPGPADFTGKSMGQTLVILTEIMLQIQPPGTCLLLDDVFCCFDQDNVAYAAGLLCAHEKQVILTLPSHAERHLRTLCEHAAARTFHLPFTPPIRPRRPHE